MSSRDSLLLSSRGLLLLLAVCLVLVCLLLPARLLVGLLLLSLLTIKLLQALLGPQLLVVVGIKLAVAYRRCELLLLSVVVDGN